MRKQETWSCCSCKYEDYLAVNHPCSLCSNNPELKDRWEPKVT